MKSHRIFPAFALSLSLLATAVLAPAAFAADVPNAGPNTSYVACYFGDPASPTWKWALKSDNAWFSITGYWATTPQTKLQKFFTSTTHAEILQACGNAKAYYKLKDNLFAAFAATSSTGSNYPLVSNGVELYPSN